MFFGNKIDIFFWRKEFVSLQELKMRCQHCLFPPCHILFLPPKERTVELFNSCCYREGQIMAFFNGKGAIEKLRDLSSVGVDDANRAVALVLLSWCLSTFMQDGICTSDVVVRVWWAWAVMERIAFTSCSALLSTMLLIARRILEWMRWPGPH